MSKKKTEKKTLKKVVKDVKKAFKKAIKKVNERHTRGVGHNTQNRGGNNNQNWGN